MMEIVLEEEIPITFEKSESQNWTVSELSAFLLFLGLSRFEIRNLTLLEAKSPPRVQSCQLGFWRMFFSWELSMIMSWKVKICENAQHFQGFSKTLARNEWKVSHFLVCQCPPKKLWIDTLMEEVHSKAFGNTNLYIETYQNYFYFFWLFEKSGFGPK